MRVECRKLKEDKQEYRNRAQHEARAIREAIEEEGNVCAQEFRKDAVTRERDLKVLKEQYAAVQEAYGKRILDLQTRLKRLRMRYKDLERRRKLEIEGFTNDTSMLKRQLYKLESICYGNVLTSKIQNNGIYRLNFTI